MAKRLENTKIVFQHKALELFSERGYGSVTVADIAKEVGCTAPALYKHYKSKRELFEAILEESKKGYETSMAKLKVDFEKQLEDKEQILNLTVDDYVQLAKNMLLHPLSDSLVTSFRKLMMVEQFRMEELAVMYNERYIFMQYQRVEILFKLLMDEGYMREGDPKTLAVTLVSPIAVLIGVCDREPMKKEWALEMIEKHIREFAKNYSLRGSNETK